MVINMVMKVFFFVLGLFIINHGIKVIDTGIILYAPNTEGVIHHAGKLAKPLGIIIILSGFWVLYEVIKSNK